MHLKDISLNYKIPLRVAVLVIITASVLAPVLVYRSISDLRDNMVANADSIAQVIADTLVPPMLHDDVWRAYEIINTPFRISHDQAKAQGAEYILVLDAANKVFVSTQPEKFPMLSDPLSAEPGISSLLKPLPPLDTLTPTILESRKSNSFYLATAIQSDGVRLARLS